MLILNSKCIPALHLSPLVIIELFSMSKQCMCMLSRFSRVQLFVTLGTAAD